MLRNLSATLLLGLIVLLCAACADQAQLPLDNEQLTGTQLPAGDTFSDQLPALPAADGVAREVSDVQERSGEMAFMNSAGVSFGADDAQLEPGVGEFQWVMYQFDTAAPPPQLQSLNVQATFATGYYIALSNYSTGRWDISGPYGNSQILSLTDTGEQLTNGTHTYVALLSYDGDQALIKSVSLSTPTPVTPDWVHTYGIGDDGLSSIYENLQGLTSDASGNVYALSSYIRGDEPYDYFMNLLRYDKDGALTLSKLLRYPDQMDVQDIAVDASGNIYLCLIDNELELIKLDPDGDLLWAKTYEYTSIGSEQWRMRMDSDGNLLVSGGNRIYQDPDRGCVAKFDADGNPLWGRQWPHAVFVDDVELAILGTDIYVLDDNGTSDQFESKYPLLIGFDKDGTLLDSKVMTMSSGEPLFAAFNSETITTYNGKIYVGGLAQQHIDGQFHVIHKVAVLNPNLTVDHWFSGGAELPGIIGTQTLSMAFASDGALHMLGIQQDDTFNIARFAPDESLAGAWSITGTDPAKVLVVGDYFSDEHRGLLSLAPDGSIYLGGSSRDMSGLSLIPGGVSSHNYDGTLGDITLDIIDLDMTASDVAGVQVNDAEGEADTAHDEEDPLVMRLSLN